MAVREILLLGNPQLYRTSAEVIPDELERVGAAVEDLHDTLIDFRERHGAGRAIAAPQIGVMKRLVYMFNDKPHVFINPKIENKGDEMIEVWDDCMSFPELLVRVKRHRSCIIEYRDLSWKNHALDLSGDPSELLQHECDHLDGILAVSRAIDGRSFAIKGQDVSQEERLKDQ
jgi:peptide deformylase